jgi:hypothetical protein
MARIKRLVRGRKGLKTIRSKALRKALIPVKRKRRFKPNNKLIDIKVSIKTNFKIAVVLREIKKFQKSTDLLIPFILFTRLVKEIIYNIIISGFGRI